VFTAVSLGLIGVASDQQNQIRTVESGSNPNPTSSRQGVYTLTLLIANNQFFSSAQGLLPQYYLLGPDGLESSANIGVPADTTIKLVIVNYDDGGNNMSSQLATASGALGNTMTVFNGTSITLYVSAGR